MMEVQGNWEMAKSLTQPTRRSMEWELAEAEAAKLRSQGFVAVINTNAAGGPVVTVVPQGAA
jgi:hypothetical protein